MAEYIRIESARRRRESELALEAARTSEATTIETAPEEDDTLILRSTRPVCNCVCGTISQTCHYHILTRS